MRGYIQLCKVIGYVVCSVYYKEWNMKIVYNFRFGVVKFCQILFFLGLMKDNNLNYQGSSFFGNGRDCLLDLQVVFVLILFVCEYFCFRMGFWVGVFVFFCFFKLFLMNRKL